MTPHYIVINPGRGPATLPSQHDSPTSAVNEAKRLASLHPGERFVVYKSFCDAQNKRIEVRSLSPEYDKYEDEIPF